MTFWRSLAPAWQACLEEAWDAFRAGSRPIGAVLVDRDGDVVARGRNRAWESAAPAPQLSGHRLAHAEINALLTLVTTRPDVDPSTSSLYSTMEPCPLCVGAVRMLGLGQVHYASSDPLTRGTALLGANDFMLRGAIRVVGPERSDLEAILGAMHVAFVMEAAHRQPGRATQWNPDNWHGTALATVRLGQLLLEEATLASLCDSGASAESAWEEIASLEARRAG